MSLALDSNRGACLKSRLAVNGIQKASRGRSWPVLMAFSIGFQAMLGQLRDHLLGQVMRACPMREIRSAPVVPLKQVGVSCLLMAKKMSYIRHKIYDR